MKDEKAKQIGIDAGRTGPCRWYSANGCANIWHPCGHPCDGNLCADYREDKPFCQQTQIVKYPKAKQCGKGMSYIQWMAFYVHAYAIDAMIAERRGEDPAADRSLGDWVRFYRMREGLSVEAMAQLCGLKPDQIEKIERGGISSGETRRKIMLVMQMERTGGKE